MHLQVHDRSSVRVISTEAAESLLIASHGYEDATSALCRGLLAGIFTRAEDLLSTVRLRAVETLSGLLNSYSGRDPQQLNWLFGEVKGNSDGFPWKSVLTLIDLRLLDEKSAVRRAAVGLLDTCASLFSEYTTVLSLPPCCLVNAETINMLVDDSSVIVRQRMVSFIGAALGEFCAGEAGSLSFDVLVLLHRAQQRH